MLFRHDYSSENMLLPINAVSDVTEDSVVEIVVSGRSLNRSIIFSIVHRDDLVVHPVVLVCPLIT